MTEQVATEIVTDVSYFGTMMVHLGMADGMVSGAVHTTAHTIRPSFEIIKTAPGTKIVSSVFLMCLSDRVLVYGDCAVNPDPTAPQLADIAISSAGTAAQFGIDPRVAMLSYSTGTSGSGADVEKVRAATDIVHAAAARPAGRRGRSSTTPRSTRWWPSTKLPDSPVAGRATVLIFPDLNTGNNTYKAVQRSAERGGHRAGAAGPEQAGQRPVPGRAGRRHREHRRHHRDPGAGRRPWQVPGDASMTSPVLVINSGSSSMKYQLVDPADGQAVGHRADRADRRRRGRHPQGRTARR